MGMVAGGNISEAVTLDKDPNKAREDAVQRCCGPSKHRTRGHRLGTEPG